LIKRQPPGRKRRRDRAGRQTGGRVRTCGRAVRRMPGSAGAMLETCGSAGEGCTFPVIE